MESLSTKQTINQRLSVQEKKDVRSADLPKGNCRRNNTGRRIINMPSSSTSKLNRKFKTRYAIDNLDKDYYCGDYNYNEGAEYYNQDSNWYRTYPIPRTYETNFINANCQVLTLPGIDVSLTLHEPDATVSWDNIGQIRYPISEELECPICLYPPSIPRMGKCGHVYCLACVYRYIGYENECAIKKCAICTAYIQLDELTRVKITTIKTPKVGDDIKLTLVRRARGSTQSVPCAAWTTHSTVGVVHQSDQFLSPFSRVVVASEEDMCKLVKEEVDSLTAIIEVSQADDWSKHEIPELNELLGKLQAELNAFQKATTCVNVSRKVVRNKEKNTAMTTFVTTATESGAIESALEPPQTLIRDLARRARKTSTCEEPYYYYYQMADGQDVYLHGVNWNCIAKEYPNRDDWPFNIDAVVLDVNHLKMDVFVRKRWRYLNHIPLGRSFSIVELDLRPPLISRETLLYFEPILSIRRASRLRRVKHDQQLTRQKEIAENRILNLPENFVLVGPANLNEPLDMSDFVPLVVSTSPGLTNATSLPSRLSFAAITRAGASSLVDKDRVLNMTKMSESANVNIPPPPPSTVDVLPGASNWPSLGDASSISPVHPVGAWGNSKFGAQPTVLASKSSQETACGEAWSALPITAKTRTTTTDVDLTSQLPLSALSLSAPSGDNVVVTGGGAGSSKKKRNRRGRPRSSVVNEEMSKAETDACTDESVGGRDVSSGEGEKADYSTSG